MEPIQRQGDWWMPIGHYGWLWWDAEQDEWKPACMPPPPPDQVEPTPAILVAYEVAAEHFRHDLRMFWEHYLLFVLIQGGLMTVLAAMLGDGDGLDNDVLAVFCSIGITLAVYWAIIAVSRRGLVQRWRVQVRALDDLVNPLKSYRTVEDWVEGGPLRGPLKIACLLPLIFIVGWISLAFAIGG